MLFLSREYSFYEEIIISIKGILFMEYNYVHEYIFMLKTYIIQTTKNDIKN